MDGPIAEEFTQAASWLVSLASKIPDDSWDQVGLGVWDVRSLLGHTARALTTVVEYLAKPATEIDVESAVDYLSAAVHAAPDAIAARGIVAGEALGADPLASVAAMAERASELVASSPAEATLSTIAGGMTLEAYLPTRTLELIVHGCDLAAALELDDQPPSQAVLATCKLLLEVQLRQGSSSSLCLALAGRPMAPEGLTIWPSESSSSH